MLYLQPKSFRNKNAAFFHHLHQKYLVNPNTPEFLSRAFPNPEVRSQLIRFRHEVFDRFILFVERQAAHAGNPYQVKRQREFFGRAELPVIMNQREIIRRLRSVGGRKARLKHQATKLAERIRYAVLTPRLEKIGIELWKIERAIKNLEALSKIYSYNPQLDVEQDYWHYLAVLAYESLPAYGSTSRRRSHVQPLCKWLSIPEIGLKCTQDTIKAAKKRMADKEKFNQFTQATLTKTSSGISIHHRAGKPMAPAESLNRV